MHAHIDLSHDTIDDVLCDPELLGAVSRQQSAAGSYGRLSVVLNAASSALSMISCCCAARARAFASKY